MQALELSIFEFLSDCEKIITAPFHRAGSIDVFCAKDFYKKISSENFLGMFTLQKNGEKKYTLIDGYSRLMLFSLLLCAVRNNNIEYEDFVKQLKTSSAQNLKIEFLGDENEFYKAVSTNYFNDLATCPKNLSDVYNFFLQKTALNRQKTNLLLKKIFNQKAIFIITENDEISSSVLYKSFNSQCKNLCEYDEIKAHAYLACQNSPFIFNNYFLQFEKEYAAQSNETLALSFIKDYLTIQNNGIIPQEGKIAEKFKAFLDKIIKIRDHKLVFEDFYRYSKYYLQIVNETVNDEEIKEEIEKINEQGADDAYPYLMEVFEDWDKNIIDKNILIDILKMINMFIEQRKAPDAPDFVMTFAKLSKNINKMLALKDYTPKIQEEMSLTINKICNN